MNFGALSSLTSQGLNMLKGGVNQVQKTIAAATSSDEPFPHEFLPASHPNYVRYYVQQPLDEPSGGFDEDESIMILEKNPGTVGNLKSLLPLKGPFHIRFKIENSAFGHAWADIPDEGKVPYYKGHIHCKVLMLKANPRGMPRPAAVAQQAPTSMSSASFQRSPPVAAAPPASAPAMPHSGATSAPVSASNNFGDGFGAFASAPASGAASATPQAASPTPATPTASSNAAPPDREEIRRQLEAEKAAKMAKASEDFRRQQEEQAALQDKLNEVRQMQKGEVDRWAFEDDGKTLKDIRALLSTVHTLMWPESDWKALDLGDLMMDSQVTSAVKKARLALHPDKVASLDTATQAKASAIFQHLTDAVKNMRRR